MATSVNMDIPLPVWKRSLLEKRQRLDEKQRKTNVECLSQMPQWKRDVLLRKQSAGKNVEVPSAFVLNRNRSSNAQFNDVLQQEGKEHVTNVNDTNGNLSENDEHLVPIRQNPIWRSDVEKRLSGSLTRTNIKYRGSKLSDSDSSTPCGEIQFSKPTLDSSSKCHEYRESTAPSEDGSDTELVYGQGFVSRLLNRFRQLSLKQENSLNRHRSVSTDNLFDGCQISVGNDKSAREGFLVGSRSVDNLMDWVINENCVDVYNDNSISGQLQHIPDKITVELSGIENNINLQHIAPSTEPTVDEFPKPNTVVTVRTVFEKIGKATGSLINGNKSSLPQVTRMCMPRGSHSIINQSVNSSRATSNRQAAVVSPIINYELQSNHAGVENSNLLKSGVKQSYTVNHVSTSSGESNHTSDVSKRYRLNLNLSEASSTKKRYSLSDRMHSSATAGNQDITDQMSISVQSSHEVVDSSYVESPCGTDFENSENLYEKTFNGHTDDENDPMPREGDPSELGYRRVQYEFEGAGVIVDRSLLSKSKVTKQMTISFNESATVTHEYPSEQSLSDLSTDPDDSGYYDLSLSSYKLRSMTDSYQLGPAAQASSVSDGNIVYLKPVDSDLPVWSNSATSDLLF